MVDVALLAFDRLTPLDLVGPYEVLSRLPGARLRTLSPTGADVVGERGLRIGVDGPIAGTADVLVVPGGAGIDRLIDDDAVLDAIVALADGATWVTSVCTGSLVLGAAGLLVGKRATSHWLSVDLLPLVGALPVRKRVVEDGRIVTGGGVTPGIDFGLALAARIAGEDVAREIALVLEYAPDPPFPGSPEDAGDVVGTVTTARRGLQDDRRARLAAAAARRGLRSAPLHGLAR